MSFPIDSPRRRFSAPWAKLGRPLVPFLAAVLALGSCGGAEPTQEPRPKRIALITLDTLRFDGFTPELMPETHRLFGRGLVFSKFYSATSTTQPTHATILTGRHPWEHGVTRNGLVLAEHHETLPEVLQDEGFWTAAIVTSYPLKGTFGYGQGFDDFDDEFAVDYSRTWVGEDVEGGSFYSLGEDAAARARAAVAAAPAGPQFFWFHFFDPHDPYGDTPSGEGEVVVQLPALRYLGDKGDASFADWLPRARAQYDRDIQDLDRHLAGLIQAIVSDAAYETTVILTADHGESFGEDGSLGHGDRVNSSQVHVPLAILQAEVGAGEREDVAGSADLAVTVARLAGIAESPFGGRDLLDRRGSPAWPDASQGAAFGMRRLLPEFKEEKRLDGTRHDQSLPVFYAHHKGQLIEGDSQETRRADVSLAPREPVEPEDSGGTVPDGEKLRALFSAFESSLEGAGAEELDSSAAREALGVLGYGR